MEILNIKELITFATLLAMVNFGYKLGVMSYINASDFYKERENREKLLGEARENLMDPSKCFLLSLIHALPLGILALFIYLLTAYTAPKWGLIISSGTSAGVYLFAPLLLIVEVSELIFSYNRNRQTIDENANIHYDRPQFIVITIVVLFIACEYITQTIDSSTKSEVLKQLQISDARAIKISNIFFFGTYFANVLVIKPMTKFVVRLDKAIYLERIRGRVKNKNEYITAEDHFSIIGTVSWILSIILIIGSGALMVITKTYKLPLGDLMIMICVITMFSVQAGQRAEHIKATRRHHYKGNRLFYKNTDSKMYEIK